MDWWLISKCLLWRPLKYHCQESIPYPPPCAMAKRLNGTWLWLWFSSALCFSVHSFDRSAEQDHVKILHFVLSIWFIIFCHCWLKDWEALQINFLFCVGYEFLLEEAGWHLSLFQLVYNLIWTRSYCLLGASQCIM